MRLCLINNDPTSTLFVSLEGEPLYSIETPPRPYLTIINDGQTKVHSRPECDGPASATMPTVVKRLSHVQKSTGHVETEIAMIECSGPGKGTRMTICSKLCGLKITAPAADQRFEASNDKEDKGNYVMEGMNVEEETSSWEFVGPDMRRYKWQFFVHSPVFMLAEKSSTPLAFFRRAKIGIVSRSRRAYLEILPTGTNFVDFIVITFVAFMKQCILIDMVEPSDSSGGTNSLPNSPVTPSSPFDLDKMTRLSRVHTS